jgi:hypothetical protein
MVPGQVFGNMDYFQGLAIILDTYSNHNGPHNVSLVDSSVCLHLQGHAVLGLLDSEDKGIVFLPNVHN